MADRVVLYDGECGLSARVVQFVLPRDRHDRFRFAALQSDYGQAALVRHGLRTDDFDTFVLLHQANTPAERVRVRSDAGLDLLVGLGGPWVLAAVLRLVPRFVRDAVYDFIAARRLRFFGKADQCLVPIGSARAKFLA